MKESNVKTALEFINDEYGIDHLSTVIVMKDHLSIIGLMQEYGNHIQYHITKLEARVKELEEALQKIKNECLCGSMSKQPKKVVTILEIAEQALNKTKQK